MESGNDGSGVEAGEGADELGDEPGDEPGPDTALSPAIQRMIPVKKTTFPTVTGSIPEAIE